MAATSGVKAAAAAPANNGEIASMLYCIALDS